MRAASLTAYLVIMKTATLAAPKPAAAVPQTVGIARAGPVERPTAAPTKSGAVPNPAVQRTQPRARCRSAVAATGKQAWNSAGRPRSTYVMACSVIRHSRGFLENAQIAIPSSLPEHG